MRKGFFATGMLLIVVFASVYLFIPSRLIISEVGMAKCSLPAAKRFIFDGSNWQTWSGTDSFSGEEYSHRIENTFFSNTDIIISKDDEIYRTNLLLIPYNIDSIGIEWRDTIYPGNNPFTRITGYIKARNLKKHTDSLMGRLLSFLNDKQKIYSINVFIEQVVDQPLLSRRIVMDKAPTAEDAYNLIKSVREYARQQGDSATGSAMKYTSKIDTGHYELMVAIPTAKMLKSNKDFVAKGLVGGNPIATEIKGGESTISNAWHAIRQYKDDYKLSSPAIPYELMITDRTREPDTSKWITRIIYPTRL